MADNELVPYQPKEMTAEKRAQIAKLRDSLDLKDSNAVISFGAAAQRKTSDFVESILRSTKNKDVGGAGDLLSNLMGTLEKFNADSKNQGFLSRLISGPKGKLQKLQRSYQSIEDNIDGIISSLEKHRKQLMENTAMLDKLYEKNVEYIDELELYITAGEEKMEEIHDEILPAIKAEADNSSNQIIVQRYKDMVDAADRLEKKIHDLKLTKTVSLQSLPQIRLQQSGNNVLVDKIHSSIVNAIPLWKSQMVIALGLAQTNRAMEAQKAVSETTNKLLRQNSEMLKTTTVETAKAVERAIVDIETISKANDDIISTIQQVVSIQQEGRAKRIESEKELIRLEAELKKNIINALDGGKPGIKQLK